MKHWQIVVDGGFNQTDGFMIRDFNLGAERFIIDTNGDVGIGDLDPVSKLHVDGTVRATAFTGNTSLTLQTNGTTRIFVKQDNGHIGLGIVNPMHPLELASGAHCDAGGMWMDASSRTLKDNITPLSLREAQLAFQQLVPVKFNYIRDPQEDHVGFIAEDVPELVATNERKSLSSMEMVAVLVKVVQDQQSLIEQQQKEMEKMNSRLLHLEQQLKR
jgi:hypothetical protein